MSLLVPPVADHRAPRAIIEDSMRARLAMTVADVLAEATISGQYRILARLPVDALAVLLAGCRAEPGSRMMAGVCAWCSSATHLEVACPDLPLDIALALYESA